MPKVTKVPVSRRAVIQRIDRKLAEGGKLVLKGMRGRGNQQYFVLNTKTNRVEFIDLEAYGRRLRLLREWEEVTNSAPNPLG
jgi:hypothetical protein